MGNRRLLIVGIAIFCFAILPLLVFHKFSNSNSNDGVPKGLDNYLVGYSKSFPALKMSIQTLTEDFVDMGLNTTLLYSYCEYIEYTFNKTEVLVFAVLDPHLIRLRISTSFNRFHRK